MKYQKIVYTMVYFFHPMIGFGAGVKVKLRHQNHNAMACYHSDRGWWI